MMVRQIITPQESIVKVQLPEKMVGKTIELLAFEIEAETAQTNGSTKDERLKKIEELTASSLVDLREFRFNRNEANDYNE